MRRAPPPVQVLPSSLSKPSSPGCELDADCLNAANLWLPRSSFRLPNSARQMPSFEVNAGQELSGWARHCGELFQKLLSTLVGHGGIGTHYRTVRDYSQRFELWAGFIGVFANGGASLDNRLRFYPEVRDLVLRMLKLLERNLSHGFWFDPASKEGVDGKALPIILSETSTSLAAVAALDAIQQSIDRLRRLAVLIRKSPSSSLTPRVEAFARKVDPAKIEEFQKIASLFVTGRLPGINSGLVTQLVSSISFRRLRLLYQGKHNEKLKGRRTQTMSVPSQPEAETRRQEEDPAPTREYLSRPAILQTETAPSGPLQQPTISETENSGLDFEKFQLYDGGSTDVSDTSTITSIAQGYSYPPRPIPGKGNHYCACNWCSDAIKVSNLDIPGWWRAHFKKDLQPYVCISEDCSEPAVYFTSFSKWRKHMDDVHTTDWARIIHSPQVWYCDVSPHEYLEFGEKEELEHHLQNEHSNDMSSKQLERRLARNVLPSPREKSACPLCKQDILKIHELQEKLLTEDRTAHPIILDQKTRPYKSSRVRFQDVGDFSSSDEETFKDLADDVSSLNTEERKKMDLGKVSKHIAGHLKSLAFLSIRYLDHDAVAGEGDSGKAASGADDTDIEGPNGADKATERILDDFPEAAYDKLDFEDIQAERIGVGEDSSQTQKDTAECHELFRLATDRKYERYKDQVETWAEGTCQWFLRHENFKKWLQQDSGVLLVTADPGCGKSVLAKHLIDEVLPQSATICYFFFEDPDQNTLCQALCALLHQLFCYQPSLIRHAIPEYAMYRRGLVEMASSLWHILTKAGRDLVIGPLVIVLDALDECTELDMNCLARNLQRLPEHSEMKFLLTSRPYVINSIYMNNNTYTNNSKYTHIVTRFQEPVGGFTCIHIPGEEQSNTTVEEVHRLIKYRVEQLATDRTLSKQIKYQLVKRLLDIFHPTYLWVYLVFEYLRTLNLEDAPEEIATTVASLPDNINEAYEQMLGRSTDRRIVLKALSIILAAWRPLTISEMNVAMNINKQSNSIGDIELEKAEDFKSRLKSLFGLFVSFRGGKVDLFHHTARTFLLAKSPSPATAPSEFHWKHSITGHYAHSILAGLCVLYLSLFNSEVIPLLDTHGEASRSIDSYAFLNYSAQRWITHFLKANTDKDDSGIEPLAIDICDIGSRAYSVWSKIFEEDYRRSPLSRAIKEGQEAIVRLLLFANPQKSAAYTTLLWQALENENVAVVQLLLDRGVGLESKNNYGQTPLLCAAENGHIAVVQLLLDRGANVDSEDKWGNNPLSMAEKWNQKAVVQLLRSRR
ncbi:hypothetical protein F4782DRAFT_502146 [Xylaria castorea]|nr:hypothetical protein F4782DRAFT_502146 [Xylaria castorea]